MKHSYILALLVCTTYTLYSNYPYQASPLLSSHRFERKHLITCDLDVSYGSCKHAHTSTKEKVNVLGIYNQEKLHLLGKNVPNQSLENLNTLILDALWHTVSPDPLYASLDFTGSFSSSLVSINAGFNITESFFLQCEIPVHHLKIKNPTYTDATPTESSTIEWQTFLAHFDDILKNANLSRDGYSIKDCGDIKVAAGWARNVEEIGQLYSFDTLIQMGLVLPTAAAQKINKVFSIPAGNNKHTGIFFTFDTHAGITDYLTINFHAEQTVFNEKKVTRRVKTAAAQNGWIKLSQAPVTEEWGNKYSLGGYITYHYDALACTTGYTYYHQNKHILVPEDTAAYSSTIINADPMLAAWSTHTWHIQVEYNMADTENIYHPRVALSYNHILQSHNTFLNHTMSGTLGLSITTEF